ncbi:MAG: transposase [Proteobacteria bacterium]|nr:transposase [Pseudomonadota bacterium]
MKGLKNIRLKNYDYSADGHYFVTIASNDRAGFSADDLKLIEEEIRDLPAIKGIGLDFHVLMADHLHLILVLTGCGLKLGEVVRRFKAKTSKKAGRKLWQPNYYEHVIRNEEALRRIREYVQNNPLVEKIEFEDFYKNECRSRQGRDRSL